MADAASLFMHGDDYAQYRPTYPPGLFERIDAYSRAASRDLAVDVGTGSGQALPGLLERYSRVIGVEPSSSQAEAASKAFAAESRARIVSASAEAFGSAAAIGESSAQLVCAFQAAHWFDLPRFYAECLRVLSPGGVVALVGYGRPRVRDVGSGAVSRAIASSANAAIDRLHDEDLGPYWDPRRGLVDGRYKDFAMSVQAPGAPMDAESRVDDISIDREMPLSVFCAYLETWSSYRTLLRERGAAFVHGDPSVDPIAHLRAELQALWAASDPAESDPVVPISWPLFVVLTRTAL